MYRYAPNASGGTDIFHAEMEHGSRAGDITHAVGRRGRASRPDATDGRSQDIGDRPEGRRDRLPGYNWVTVWCDVCAGSNVFAVLVDSVERARVTTTSKGPVSIRWDTHAVSNNANHTITVKVTNGAKVGTSAGVTVRVANQRKPSGNVRIPEGFRLPERLKVRCSNQLS